MTDYTLFLDDERMPGDAIKGPVIICRTAEAFKSTIRQFGLPQAISFDNDLGGAEEGRHCARWLLDYLLDLRDMKSKIPRMTLSVHSQNPVAAKEILAIINDIRKEIYHDLI